MARSRLVVGAQVVVYINGAPYGRVADFGWSDNSPRKEVACVDWLGPWELIPTSTRVQGNMTIYRLHRDGGIEASGMKATWRDVPREKYFSVLVLDRSTDTVIFQANKCSINSQSWRVGKGYVMGTINFTALEWNNETPDSLE